MPAKASEKKGKDCSYRGVEYRLCPGSRSKARKLAGLAGACRFVWNAILVPCQEEYEDERRENPRLSFEPLAKPLLQDRKYSSGAPRAVLILKIRSFERSSFFSLGKRFTELRNKVDWLPRYSFKIVRYILTWNIHHDSVCS